MKAFKLLTIPAALFALSACSTTAQAPQTASVTQQDINAITAGYQLIQFDLAECSIMAGASGTPQVMAISSKICADAASYKTNLEQLAAANNVTLPNDLRYDLKMQVVSLHYHPDPSMSSQYLRDEINSHETSLLIFEDEAQNGSTPQLKSYFAQAVPLVQGNLNALKAAQ